MWVCVDGLLIQTDIDQDTDLPFHKNNHAII